MSPYTEQNKEIRKKIKATILKVSHLIAAELKQVVVDTVDGAQGTEFEIVVASTVKDGHKQESHFDDDRRFNVGTSRARRAQIIVTSFKFASTSRNLRTVLVDLYKAGSVIDERRKKGEIIDNRHFKEYIKDMKMDPGTLIKDIPENFHKENSILPTTAGCRVEEFTVGGEKVKGLRAPKTPWSKHYTDGKGMLAKCHEFTRSQVPDSSNTLVTPQIEEEVMKAFQEEADRISGKKFWQRNNESWSNQANTATSPAQASSSSTTGPTGAKAGTATVTQKNDPPLKLQQPPTPRVLILTKRPRN